MGWYVTYTVVFDKKNHPSFVLDDDVVSELQTAWTEYASQFDESNASETLEIFLPETGFGQDALVIKTYAGAFAGSLAIREILWFLWDRFHVPMWYKSFTISEDEMRTMTEYVPKESDKLGTHRESDTEHEDVPEEGPERREGVP